MSSGPVIERQKSESLDIPPRRVEITDPSQLPSDFSTTPGGTIFSTTPGGMLRKNLFIVLYVLCVLDISRSEYQLKHLQFLDNGLIFIARAELVST